MRAQSSMGLGRKVSVSSKKGQKQRFTLQVKPGQRRRPLQNLLRNEKITSRHAVTLQDVTKDKDWAYPVGTCI